MGKCQGVLFTALARAAEMSMSKFDERNLANTAWAFAKASQTIMWFWSVVCELSQEELALFVQFVTGTAKGPAGGFAALQGTNGPQKFQIHKLSRKGALPQAHTCFNQLDLPEYPSEDIMRVKLFKAVEEAHEGFGFV